MPDSENYNLAQMKEYIDVGSLPDHLKDQTWEMLEQQAKAFSFNGRLSHHPAKVHIHAVDGQVPIV
jgi:hypothetical protein